MALNASTGDVVFGVGSSVLDHLPTSEVGGWVLTSRGAIHLATGRVHKGLGLPLSLANPYVIPGGIETWAVSPGVSRIRILE